MRLLATLLFVCACLGFAVADAPFPDTPKNHWVYVSMKQMRKDHLWYRVNDNVPKRAVATRMDVATKTLLLALDSKNLLDSLQSNAQMVSVPAEDAQSKQWAKNFAADFPKRKILYRNHLKQVKKLWNYFKPEIAIVAKTLKVDPRLVSNNLTVEQKELEKIHLAGKVAMSEGFSDVPAGHWAAKAVSELKVEGILVGYPS
jgi:hypothetical protein